MESILWGVNFVHEIVEVKLFNDDKKIIIMETEKQKQLIKMVSEFSDEYLDDEYKALNIRLVEKLGRKREVPFKRGKIENWASGIVYTIAQLNFLFDSSFEPVITADDICNFFNTKKSTAANKARDIRKLLNLKLGDEEFSSEIVIESDISRLGGNMNQAKTLNGAQSHSGLREIGDMLRQIHVGSQDLDLVSIIHDIQNSSEEYILHEDFTRLAYAVRQTTFISTQLKDKDEYIIDVNGIMAIPVFTSKEKFDMFSNLKSKEWSFMHLALLFEDKDIKLIVINPGSENFCLTKEMVRNILFDI